jgi:hypothetical protein
VVRECCAARRTLGITSQDERASRLLGGKSAVVKIDSTEHSEGISLLSNVVDVRTACEISSIKALMEQVVHSLDVLPLAIGLAGARVKADADDGEGSGSDEGSESGEDGKTRKSTIPYFG